MAGFGLGRVYLFTALQQQDYRWLWLNIFCYSMGRWMEWVALSWLLLGGLLGLGAWLVLFSLSSWYILSLLLLAATGIMHTSVMIMLQTLLQSHVPDELRGRVMGIYVLTWGAVPLGSLQAGAVASWLGAPFAVGIGGVMIILVATGLLTTQPKVRRLE